MHPSPHPSRGLGCLRLIVFLALVTLTLFVFALWFTVRPAPTPRVASSPWPSQPRPRRAAVDASVDALPHHWPFARPSLPTEETRTPQQTHRIERAPVVVSGDLTRSVVETALHRRPVSLARCAAMLSPEDGEEAVTVVVMVGGTGLVLGANERPVHTLPITFARCVSEQYRRVQFPAPHGSFARIEITYVVTRLVPHTEKPFAQGATQ